MITLAIIDSTVSMLTSSIEIGAADVVLVRMFFWKRADVLLCGDTAGYRGFLPKTFLRFKI